MTVAQPYDRLLGRSLGEFVLRERIGEGGFGAVYRASQPALDREAVVKVLHARLHASKGAIERFLREAKLASKLDHPYAAHIYAFGAEPDGELWIAMELVRGTPLDKLLKIQGPLPLERFVPLLDRICEVVHTAHEQGIVHRDLKPANVMVLARAGRLLPKLLDFGIAKGLADTGEVAAADGGLSASAGDEAPLDLAATQQTISDLTQRGAIVGSPPYMAPEQWIDAGHVDARTDLYALAILAYECLTGKPPFTGDTVTMIAMAHANDAPAPLGARFPAALDQVFEKALAKDPDARYTDALAMAAAFRHASGIAADAVALPALDPAQRDVVLASAPQPIAEAVAALDAARNVYQARDAIVQLARTIARFLGLLALACRSRIASGDEPTTLAEVLRTLYRRELADSEWLELARLLTHVWRDRRDAYPLPELVDAFEDDAIATELAALAALRDDDARREDALLAVLEEAVARVGRILDRLAFLGDYALVVTVADGLAERWTGVRRAQRTNAAVRGRSVAAGVAALLDRDGAPVLSLAPLFQIAPPTPGAPVELFLFEGRDARGAKLVALPGGFEHHDNGVWDWFRVQLAASIDDAESETGEEQPPYRGLQAFTADDRASFFGRERQVDAFVNRLKLQPLLAVVGRSGAGKSSFVHAGVVPALGWRAVTLRPGVSPLGALAARLESAGFARDALASLRAAVARDREVLGALLRADAAARGPIVLVVDQLEEMFTLCRDDAERRAFAGALAVAARAADDPVRIIFTLRDDFLVRTEEIPALRNRIGQGLELLTVPADDELRRIVVEPARRAGYELERDLAASMVEEVAD
ncbi:MAG: serine/threonine-protein kinase, partial [Acidobacteriota bacterium]